MTSNQSSSSGSSSSSMHPPQVGEERLMVIQFDGHSISFKIHDCNSLIFLVLLVLLLIRLPFEFGHRLIWKKTNAFKSFQRNHFISMMDTTSQRNICTIMYLLRIQHKKKFIKQRHRHWLKMFSKDIVPLFLHMEQLDQVITIKMPFIIRYFSHCWVSFYLFRKNAHNAGTKSAQSSRYTDTIFHWIFTKDHYHNSSIDKRWPNG